MITRGEEPLNLEMPFSSLREFITPNEQFYVRGHFPIPEINVQNWRLKVEGAVASPFELTYDELRQMPSQTMTATMECAGNGRSFLQPKVKGVAWDLGAVGNAEWTGLLLGDVLRRAGVRSDAREVVLEGGDKGAIPEPPRPPGEIHYARSLPIAKASDDVLLAFEMNGQPLPASHGFPLRAVVPGWFGMASVKVAPADHRHRDAVQRLLPIDRLHLLAAAGWIGDPGAVGGDGAESANRAAVDGRGFVSRRAISGARGGVGGNGRGRRS